MRGLTLAAPSNALTEHVRPFEADGHIVAAAFLGGAPTLALADGTLVIGEIGALARHAIHPDAAILTATSDGKSLLTGGDDGRVALTRADGSSETIAHEKGKWIDALAMRDGAIAWGAGKLARARDAKGLVKDFSAPTTVRGLAFLSKGYRLAVTHYDGASLWFPNVAGEPVVLGWKGSHLEATASPDGRFLVTSMQENSLHGWRLTDQRNMRMTGYPGKSRSLSWSHEGHWLATSGADACVVWPFKDKDGPMGKAPRECGVRNSRVTQVAFHPRALVVAIGYADGFVLLCRLGDGAELLVRANSAGDGPVTALQWQANGARLLYGLETGQAGLLTLPG